MEHANRKGRRLMAIALVGGLALGLAPVSSAAGRADSGSGAPDPARTLSETAAVVVASLDPIPETSGLSEAQAAPPAPAADQQSFFKTGKGKAALALFVVAAGATLYSKYHDRVKSGIR